MNNAAGSAEGEWIEQTSFWIKSVSLYTSRALTSIFVLSRRNDSIGSLEIIPGIYFGCFVHAVCGARS